jgi:hypothetical protein
MNEENHKILADKMLKFLSGEPVYLNKNDFVIPIKQSDYILGNLNYENSNIWR